MSTPLHPLVSYGYGSDESDVDTPSSLSSVFVCEIGGTTPSSTTSDPTVSPPLDEPPSEAPAQETLHSAFILSDNVLSAIWPPPLPDVDNWGLPPAVDSPCDKQFQAKIADWHRLMETQQIYFNDRLMNNQAFRNPHLYAKLVEFLELDEIGSNFDPSVYDPHGWPEEAYAEAIVKEQQRRAEERALAHHARTQVQFVSAGTTIAAPNAAASPASPARKAKRRRWDVVGEPEDGTPVEKRSRAI